MTQATDCTLAELMIVACSEAWRGDGEILASGITTVPRLGASLAKLTHSPELLMTDSETFLVSEPVPLGPRGDYVAKFEGYMSFDRVFECVWGGKRHAMIGPTQIDRFGQSNLSCIGGDYAKPKSAVLGVRGNHQASAHSTFGGEPANQLFRQLAGHEHQRIAVVHRLLEHTLHLHAGGRVVRAGQAIVATTGEAVGERTLRAETGQHIGLGQRGQ